MSLAMVGAIADNKKRRKTFSSELDSRSKPLLRATARGQFPSHEIGCAAVNGDLWLVPAVDHDDETCKIIVLKANGTQEEKVTGLSMVANLETCANGAIFDKLDSGSLHKIDSNGITAPLNVDGVLEFAVHEGGVLVYREECRLERRDFNGTLQETIEVPFVPDVFNCDASGRKLLYATDAQVHMIDLETKVMSDVAGEDDCKGCKDGRGSVARFNNLMTPRYDSESNQLLVRDVQPGNSSRWCLICLSTCLVKTIEIKGLPKENVRVLGVEFPHMHVFTDDGCLFHIDLREDISKSTFSEDMAVLDWTEPPVAVKFSLCGGAVFHADRRILCARSAYFAAMFNAEHGMREATSHSVDFSAASINPEAFQLVLSYLATDNFYPAAPGGSTVDSEQSLLEQAAKCLEVAALADQYDLARLQHLAETYVIEFVLLNRDSMVLPLLEKAFGVNKAVEAACWQILSAKSATVLAAFGEALKGLIAKRPDVGARLAFRLAQAIRMSM
jgi:hypothetical protein